MTDALIKDSPDAKYYWDVEAKGEDLTFWDYGSVCRVYPGFSKRTDSKDDMLDGDIGIEINKETLEVTEIFGVVYLP